MRVATDIVVGLLYPGFGAEDDFAALDEKLASDSIRLPLVHTSVGEDAHRVDALLDLGGQQRLADGARELMTATSRKPDSMMWACTSGSFVFGLAGAHEQVAALAATFELPVSSTSIAFVNAVNALGIGRVSIAASYPDDVAQKFVGFLADAGMQVVQMGSHDIYTAAEVGTLTREQVVDMVRAADTPDTQAILVPDTAMHSLGWLADLEAAVGKPVLTANQVTVWEGLRIAGGPMQLPALGTLFE